MKLKSLLLLAMLATSQAYAAYFQADLKSPKTDDHLGTHLIIVGKGIEVGDLWMPIAHAQALMFKDKSAHGRIRLVSAIDRPKTFNQKLIGWGYENIKAHEKNMTADAIVKLIGSTEKIASIDFIGHNGAFLGFAMEGYDFRFFLKHVDQLKAFKSQFTKDSFIRIQGCNTGWKLAPYMAQALNVPTSGSFTSMDVEVLFTDNTWYLDLTKFQPTNHSRTKVNSVSYEEDVSCLYGAGCIRLKTIPIAYSGKRGTYSGNIPFLKYFCGSVDNNDCARRMALSVLTNIGSSPFSLEDMNLDRYAEAVSDMMCVTWNNMPKYKDCVTKVQKYVKGEIDLPRTYHSGNTTLIKCDMKSCNVKARESEKGLEMFAVNDGTQATTFVDELDMYKKGFDLIK